MYDRSITHNEGPASNSGERAEALRILKTGTHTSGQLIEKLGFAHMSSASIRVRRIILDLTLYHNTPIVADRDGYRIARTPEDVDSYVEWLESYVESVEFRINAIKQSWDAYAKKHRPPRAPRAPRKSNGVRKSKVRFPVSEKKQKPVKKNAPTKKTTRR